MGEAPRQRPRRKGQLEAPLKSLGQEHGETTWRRQEGPGHADSHSDPETFFSWDPRASQGRARASRLMVSKDAGPRLGRTGRLPPRAEVGILCGL